MPKPAKNVISAEEFIKIILFNYNGYASHNQYYKSNSELVFENIVINEPIITMQPPKGFTAEFINCEFKDIQFNDLQSGRFNYIDTEIGDLVFNNVSIGTLEFDENCKVKGKFDLFTSAFNNIILRPPIKTLHIKNSKDGRINLLLDSNVDNLLIINTRNIYSNCLGVINNCLIEGGNYPFTSFAKIKSLGISGCLTDAYISGVFENLTIANSSILHLQNIICIKDIVIKNNRSNEGNQISFFNIYVGNDLTLDNAEVGAKFILNKVTPHFVLINNLKINNGISDVLFVNSEEDIFFHVNSIEFKDFSFAKDAIWKLEKILCANLHFYNFRNFGSGNIDNTKGGSFNPMKYDFNELLEAFKSFNTNCADFINSEPSPIVYNLPEERVLTFRQSDLGKLNFINTDFSDFKLNFYSTKLNEIFLAGSKMPKKVNALEVENADLFHQQRIANSQLKKLHEQQGDVVAANEYFANEMNSYYSSLKWGSFRKKQFWEKLHLGLNKLSSNHGQNWILAMGVTLAASILFYFFFCCLLKYYPADPLKSDNRRTFWLLFSNYFEFINPIHKLDDFSDLIKKSEISSGAKILDAFSRIIDSYLIYQLIQAFRKHGRSK